jgi:hypothetical protein
MDKRPRRNLDELSKLMDLCRQKGVVKFIEDEWGNEILFGPAPAPAQAAKKAPDSKGSDLQERREYYETMLGRPVSDPELARLP